MNRMTLVADQNILLLEELFSEHCKLQALSSKNITQSALQDATGLLCRSVTRVNTELLHDTKVRYVGTASTGIDHFDTAYLDQQKIRWFNAGGSNAFAVADYVLCCIVALQQQALLGKKNIRAGIIGVGRIGSLVANLMKELGFKVILNDPPRQIAEKNFLSTPLIEFFDLDLISIHTPLIKSGAHPTFHLINEKFLSQLNPGCILLSTARGAVIDNQALLNATHIKPCLDVWENEPHINTELIKKTLIATPHIAGYTLEARQRATVMLYEKLKKYLSLPNLPKHWQKLIPNYYSYAEFIKKNDWRELALQALNPFNETQRMKKNLEGISSQEDVGKLFTHLRESYPLRHELV